MRPSRYVSLAQIFQSGDFNESSSAISTKIRQAVIDAAASSVVSLAGICSSIEWQLCADQHPHLDHDFQQHVFNTETRAWCRFTGQNALCWGLYNDNLILALRLERSSRLTVHDDNGAAILCNGQPS